MLETATVVGVVVLAVLVWFFMRTRSSDLLAEIMEKRRGSSRIVSRAEYMDGMNHFAVALALTDDMFYYENPDLQASFALANIDEIEYDDELATGRSVATGCRVMRLRSHGQTFEFCMPNADIAKWQQALPARRAGAPTAKAV